MILGVARITELVGDVARSHESIACLENKDLLSDDDLQFSGENIVPLVLARMRMTRHTYTRRETHLQEAVFSSGLWARQAYGADTDVKVTTFGSRLIFDCRRPAIRARKAHHSFIHRSFVHSYCSWCYRRLLTPDKPFPIISIDVEEGVSLSRPGTFDNEPAIQEPVVFCLNCRG